MWDETQAMWRISPGEMAPYRTSYHLEGCMCMFSHNKGHMSHDVCNILMIRRRGTHILLSGRQTIECHLDSWRGYADKPLRY